MHILQYHIFDYKVDDVKIYGTQFLLDSSTHDILKRNQSDVLKNILEPTYMEHENYSCNRKKL